MGNVTIDMDFTLGPSKYSNTGDCWIDVWGIGKHRLDIVAYADRNTSHSLQARIRIHREGNEVVFIFNGKERRVPFEPELRSQPMVIDLFWRHRPSHFRLIEIKAEGIKPANMARPAPP